MLVQKSHINLMKHYLCTSLSPSHVHPSMNETLYS
uniref:Uncharacterized protein n=1 Tax=Arundo donax TaxID=35708 RepID=A0A0A9C0A0_ARUDO